jgi:urease accessory protein
MKVQHWLHVGAALTVATVAPAAQAHILGTHDAAFGAGTVHPFIGLDHLLAMVAVGIWAALLGGHAQWRVPLAFLLLLAGAGIALAGVTLPSAGTGIASSVMVLALLIAYTVRFPNGVSLALVGIFALFHGYAHGMESPLMASAALYGLGFLLATAWAGPAGRKTMNRRKRFYRAVAMQLQQRVRFFRGGNGVRSGKA